MPFVDEIGEDVEGDVRAMDISARRYAEEAAVHYWKPFTSEEELKYQTKKAQILSVEHSRWSEYFLDEGVMPRWFLEYMLNDQPIEWRPIAISAASHSIAAELSWDQMRVLATDIAAFVQRSDDEICAGDLFHPNNFIVHRPNPVDPLLSVVPEHLVKIEIPVIFKQEISVKEKFVGRVVSWLLCIQARDFACNLVATHGLRKLLSLPNPPITVISNCPEMCKKMVQFLRCTSEPVQFESCWVLTNLLSGNSTDANKVLSFGVLPTVSKLLTTLMQMPQGTAGPEEHCLRQYSSGFRSERLVEQLIWLLGNVAGDSPRCRDMVLLQCDNILSLVCNAVNSPSNLPSMKRNAVWTLSNFCRGKPPPTWETIRGSVGTFATCVIESEEEETDALWGLSYLSDGDNVRIDSVLEPVGLVPALVKCLQHPSSAVRTPALRTLGNIVTGDDTQTQSVLSCPGFFSCIEKLLKDSRQSIRKETCWTLSNIAAGNRSQIHSLLQSGCVPLLLEIIRNDNFPVQKEACWTIVNMTSGGSSEQMLELTKLSTIRMLFSFLKCVDNNIKKVAMEGYVNFAKCLDFLVNFKNIPAVKADISFLSSETLRAVIVSDEILRPFEASFYSFVELHNQGGEEGEVSHLINEIDNMNVENCNDSFEIGEIEGDESEMY